MRRTRPAAWALRSVTAVAMLLLGATIGLASVVVHPWWWGTVLGVAATVATCAALPARWWGRTAYVVGWIGLLVIVQVPRPAGGYLIGQTWGGYLLLVLAGALLVSGVVTLPGVARLGRRTRGGDPRSLG